METNSKNVAAYAGFANRVFAFIIDSIIISAIVFAFFVFVVPFLYHPFPILYNILSGPLVSDNYSSLILNMLIVWTAFFLIIQCFYVTILESSSLKGHSERYSLGYQLSIIRVVVYRLKGLLSEDWD